MYRVCWCHRDDGEIRYGGKPMGLCLAKDWVAWGNANYPDMEHWAEPDADWMR